MLANLVICCLRYRDAALAPEQLASAAAKLVLVQRTRIIHRKRD